MARVVHIALWRFQNKACLSLRAKRSNLPLGIRPSWPWGRLLRRPAEIRGAPRNDRLPRLKSPALLLFLVIAVAACTPAPIPTHAPPTASPTSTPIPTWTPALPPTETPTPLPTSTAEPTRTPAPTQTPTPVPIVQISFWHAQGAQQHASLVALADKFNRAHATIQVTIGNQATAVDLTKRIGADAPPDLVLLYPHDIAPLATKGIIIPLDDMMADVHQGFSAADLRDLYPGFIDRYPQHQNRVYSLAFMRAMEVMYFNADLLAAAGYSKPPETWDDFVQACNLIAKPPDVFCATVSADASDFVTWVVGRGGDLVRPDGSAVAFDRQVGVDTLTLLANIFGKWQATLASRAFQEPSNFAAAKAAFTFDSTTGLAFYDRAIREAGKVKGWGIAPMPRSKEAVVGLYGPSVAIVRTNAERQKAAFIFLKWLMEPEASAEWAQATGYFPARASTRARLAGYLQSNPMYGRAFDWLPVGRTEPAVSGWDIIRNYIAEAMTMTASRKAKPEDALRDAAKKANEVLASR